MVKNFLKLVFLLKNKQCKVARVLGAGLPWY